MNNLYIKLTDKGRGVFSKVAFKEGDLICECPTIPVVEEDLTSKSLFWSYVFYDTRYPSLSRYLMSLGYGSLFNHSNNQNVNYIISGNGNIKFYAIKDINIDDELSINYGYDVDDHASSLRLDAEAQNKLFSGDTSASQGGVELKQLKPLLFDAPSNVKRSFNRIVEYFAVPNQNKKYTVVAISKDKAGKLKAFKKNISSMSGVEAIAKLKKDNRSQNIEILESAAFEQKPGAPSNLADKKLEEYKKNVQRKSSLETKIEQ